MVLAGLTSWTAWPAADRLRGASALLATLAAQWRRYAGAQIYLFDKGRSSRAAILGLVPGLRTRSSSLMTV